MLTGSQIRAARAMLGWSATELAQRAQISMPTVQRALEEGGVVFLPETGSHGPGVALARRSGTDV